MAEFVDNVGAFRPTRMRQQRNPQQCFDGGEIEVEISLRSTEVEGRSDSSESPNLVVISSAASSSLSTDPLDKRCDNEDAERDDITFTDDSPPAPSSLFSSTRQRYFARTCTSAASSSSIDGSTSSSAEIVPFKVVKSAWPGPLVRLSEFYDSSNTGCGSCRNVDIADAGDGADTATSSKSTEMRYFLSMGWIDFYKKKQEAHSGAASAASRSVAPRPSVHRDSWEGYEALTPSPSSSCAMRPSAGFQRRKTQRQVPSPLLLSNFPANSDYESQTGGVRNVLTVCPAQFFFSFSLHDFFRIFFLS